MSQSPANLFREIKLKDFSTASPKIVLEILKQVHGTDALIEALDVQRNTFSIKQFDNSLDLYMEGLNEEDKMYLLLCLLKLNVLKISLNRELLNEIEFLNKA